MDCNTTLAVFYNTPAGIIRLRIKDDNNDSVVVLTTHHNHAVYERVCSSIEEWVMSAVRDEDAPSSSSMG